MFKLAAVVLCLSGAVLCHINITSIPTSARAVANDFPFWDDETCSLYSADIFGNQLFRYSFEEDKVYHTTANGVIWPTFFIPIRGLSDRYLVGVNGSAVKIKWDGRSSRASIDEVVFNTPVTHRMLNTAFIEPNGDLYASTFAYCLCPNQPNSPYYRYTTSKGLVEIAKGFKTSVGSVLIKKTNTVYVMEGCDKKLYSFQWNPNTGHLSNHRVVMKFEDYTDDQFFVGLTADTDSDLYCGVFNGSKVIKIDPRKQKVVEEYKLPVRLVGAPEFGGPRHDTLFVTSGTKPMNFYVSGYGVDNARLTAPAGHLFKITGLDVRGVRSYRPVV